MNRLVRFIAAKRQWLLWSGALGFGLIGAVGTQGFINDRLEAERARMAGDNAVVRVIVAGIDLPAGALIDADSVAVREMPARYVSVSAVTEARFEELEGQVLKVPIRAGEPVLDTAVEPPQSGFSDRVRHGIRAMTITVDEVNSVSGMLRPGDRIDLLFSTRTPELGSASGEIATPLMQDLKVLATGRDVTDTGFRRDPGAAFSTITVEVLPEQAQKLVLAQRSGRLTALLRNPDDRNPTPAGPLDVFSLLGIARPGSQANPRPVELIVGGQGRLVHPRAAEEGKPMPPIFEQLREALK